MLPISGALAWLPNSAIPNHHIAGYSYNGSYLIYAPALLLGTLWGAGFWARSCFLAIIIIVITSPLMSISRFASNSWDLEQQHRQKLLLLDIKSTLGQLSPDTHTVLVTGIDFAFSPFDHGLSLLSLGNLGATNFSVINYV